MSDYDKKVHTVGLISTIVIIIALAVVPVFTHIVSGVDDLDIKTTMEAAISALAVFGPIAIIEFLSYAPIMGAGGLYLSFTTGNVMNMKLPAAQSGLKLANVESGTKEADVISTLSIAVSSLVTTGILFIGMILAAQLLPVLQSPTLAPAFNNLMPAIMGALTVPIIIKNPKTASVPCALIIILTLIMGYATITANQTYILPIFLIISLAWAYFLYQKKTKNGGNE